MHIISKKRINQFIEQYPDSESSLKGWYVVCKKIDFESFAGIRKLFGSADYVAPLVVFNISGNKYRLIASISYQYKKIWIRHILTHKQYDEEKWKL